MGQEEVSQRTGEGSPGPSPLGPRPSEDRTAPQLSQKHPPCPHSLTCTALHPRRKRQHPLSLRGS